MPPLLAETPLSVEECTVSSPGQRPVGPLLLTAAEKFTLTSRHRSPGLPWLAWLARAHCGSPDDFSTRRFRLTCRLMPIAMAILLNFPLPCHCKFRGSLPEPRRAAIACIRATNTGIPVTQVSHQQPLSPKCSPPPPFLVSQSWDASPARTARRMQHLRRRSCSRFV